MNRNTLSHVIAKGLRLLFAATLVAGLVIGAQPVGIAHAATFDVDTTVDDANLQACTPAPNDCSLRGAIIKANRTPGADAISLDPLDLYDLMIPPGINEDPAATGDLDITDDLLISGNGATIDGGGHDRIFEIHPGVEVSMDLIVIQNGNASEGGGIRNSGDLSLGFCTIADNDATFGGGIANTGGGTLLLIAVNILRNEAGDDGGGIYNNGGTVTMHQPDISDNTTGDLGGGIFTLGGTVRVIGRAGISGIISGNRAGDDGGGIAADEGATVTLTEVTVLDNHAGADGGGIESEEGTMTIIDSTITLNTTERQDGGGIENDRGTLIVTNSTFDRNSAGDNGGGIMNDRGVVEVTNSTISGNSAGDNGGGIDNRFPEGNRRSTLTVTNSTIYGNTADGDGGGISNREDRDRATFTNSIIASNTGGNCSGLGITSAGHNLDSGTTCGLAAAGDLSNIDPLLGPLADNGGPTLTHALRPGSPAIGTGDNAACPPTDQRGVSRPQAVRCDIGAFELQIFPKDRLLDDFTRPDGSRRLGPSWSGSVGGYIVLNPEVDVEAGGPIYWKANLFGARQEAFVTLTRVDPAGQHQSLLLKVQDNDLGQPTWRRGAIAVFYRATEGIIGIETYVPGRGWHTLATFPMTLRDGDQLGARALADGTVEAYVNGRFVGEANAGSFFAGKAGRIGLWFIVAADAMLDDFGGGTVAP